MVGEVGLDRAVAGHAEEAGAAPGGRRGPAVGLRAPDGQREPADHERVEARVRLGGERLRRLGGGEGAVLEEEVRVPGRAGVGVGGLDDHVALGEAGTPRRLLDHPAGHHVEVLGHEHEPARAAPEDHGPRVEPGLLADGASVTARPAEHQVAGGRGDVGLAHAGLQRRSGGGGGSGDEGQGDAGGHDRHGGAQATPHRPSLPAPL